MFFNTGGGIISDICQGDVDNPDTKDEASSVFSDKLSEKTVPDNTESAKTYAPDPQKEAVLSILNSLIRMKKEIHLPAQSFPFPYLP